METAELIDNYQTITGSTPAQRKYLYRLGRSKWFVRTYADTRVRAARAIETALEERRILKGSYENR